MQFHRTSRFAWENMKPSSTQARNGAWKLRILQGCNRTGKNCLCWRNGLGKSIPPGPPTPDPTIPPPPPQPELPPEEPPYPDAPTPTPGVPPFPPQDPAEPEP